MSTVEEMTIDWKMFLHHRVIFGFFFEVPMTASRHYRVIWKCNWNRSHYWPTDTVPWHRCFTWGKGKTLRRVGGPDVKVIWKQK